MNNETKVCRHCLKTKSRDSFGRHNYMKDGLQSYCRECSNTYRKGDYLKRHKKTEQSELNLLVSKNDLHSIIESLMECKVKKVRFEMYIAYTAMIVCYFGLRALIGFINGGQS